MSAPLLSPRITWWDELSYADVVIVGGGVSGLSFALRLPDWIHITLVVKNELGECNTKYAQGGMAAAVGPDDTAVLHLEDTIEAGDGLVDESAAEGMVERGASAVRWLLKQGARFDLEGHTLQLGQEAAHSRRRILHAGGDATGAEIERTLVSRVRTRLNIRVLEDCEAIDLQIDGNGRCAGVNVLRPDGAIEYVSSGTTVLATGGAGQLWQVSSNPEGATGDGIAMALRAGVRVADLEFVQFHPTVLNVPGVPPFLLTEAIRGEGAYLINSAGERFMLDIDPRAELAPRNVVAGAVFRQLTDIPGNIVYLDLRHLDRELIEHRFPTIVEHLKALGLDLASEPIPVAPAAHYYMGGIAANTRGETTLPGLLAIGEVSCTGVHGANRLASNSLLEGLVFGINAADRVAEQGYPVPLTIDPTSPSPGTDDGSSLDKANLQHLMTEKVGVVRSAEGMTAAIATLTTLVGNPPPTDRDALILRNMRELALFIATSALEREESRGGHIRDDYPETDPALNGVHQMIVVRGQTVERSWGELEPND